MGIKAVGTARKGYNRTKKLQRTALRAVEHHEKGIKSKRGYKGQSPRAVGFDLDNTLVMSEDEKAKIIARVFCKLYGVDRGIKEKYLKLIGRGMSRKEKFRAFYKKIFGEFPSRREFSKVSKEFSREYLKFMRRCPLAACANILRELRKQVGIMFVVSMEEEGDIKVILKHCGIWDCFNDIHGGPKSKEENLRHVLKSYGLKPKEVVYVGDAKNDVLAAKRLGIKFIGVNKNFRVQHLLKKLGADFVFSDLCKIPKVI